MSETWPLLLWIILPAVVAVVEISLGFTEKVSKLEQGLTEKMIRLEQEEDLQHTLFICQILKPTRKPVSHGIHHHFTPILL